MTKEEIEALFKQLIEQQGFLSKQEFNATAAMIRGLKEAVDGMKGQNPLEALVALGLLEKKDDGTFQPKAQAPAPAKKDDQEPEWRKQIRAMQEQIEAKDRALAAEKKAREEGELKNAVITAFEKAGALNSGRDYIHVLPAVKRDEDGSFFTTKKDQFGVETKVGLDAYLGEFLKASPELAKAQARPGSGTPAAAGGTGENHGPTTNVNTLASMPVGDYFASRKAGKI